MIWCLDSGHGGRDSGATNGNRYEKNDIVKVVEKVKGYLEGVGEQVILSRPTDDFVSLGGRCDFANSNRADYFISFHRDSVSDVDANGTGTFVCQGVSKNTHNIAERIVNALAVQIGFRNRGVKVNNLTVLVNTRMSAVLIEMGFISNASDNNKFDANIDKIAKVIANELLRTVGKEIVAKKKISYRVCVGSFEVYENAEVRIQEIEKKTGYKGFIAPYEV